MSKRGFIDMPQTVEQEIDQFAQLIQTFRTNDYVPWLKSAKAFMEKLAAQTFSKHTGFVFGSGAYFLGMLHSDADMCIQFEDSMSDTDACLLVPLFLLFHCRLTPLPQWLSRNLALDHCG